MEPTTDQTTTRIGTGPDTIGPDTIGPDTIGPADGPTGSVELAKPIDPPGVADPTEVIDPTGVIDPGGAADPTGVIDAPSVADPTEEINPIGAADPTGVIAPTGVADTAGPAGAGAAGAAFGAASTPPSLTQAPATETRRKFRLRRSRTDRMIAGVCGGFAESLDVDPALVRIGLVTLTVLGVGSGVVLYGAVWLLAPVTDEP